MTSIHYKYKSVVARRFSGSIKAGNFLTSWVIIAFSRQLCTGERNTDVSWIQVAQEEARLGEGLLGTWWWTFGCHKTRKLIGQLSINLSRKVLRSCTIGSGYTPVHGLKFYCRHRWSFTGVCSSCSFLGKNTAYHIKLKSLGLLLFPGAYFRSWYSFIADANLLLPKLISSWYTLSAYLLHFIKCTSYPEIL
jgi:hypothetical protein